MHEHRTIRTIATELPSLIRQLESGDPALRAAAVQRLRDWASMTEPLRAGPGGRKVSRRAVLAGAGAVTFAAMALKED